MEVPSRRADAHLLDSIVPESHRKRRTKRSRTAVVEEDWLGLGNEVRDLKVGVDTPSIADLDASITCNLV